MEWAANDFVKNKKINIYDICYVFKTSSQIFYKLVYYLRNIYVVNVPNCYTNHNSRIFALSYVILGGGHFVQQFTSPQILWPNKFIPKSDRTSWRFIAIKVL